ncbi:MAG TPA: 3'(2'),5'-bisphosphate nucleotidase CysQ [Alphaproteobacteria bacterium]|nr:3'(2'),5'-bisphosphate nucleotidase CysQ [Alphaproteobacteria bacterium]
MAFFDSDLVEILNKAAIDAGKEILHIRDRGHDVREKHDSSPVTDADEAGERIILAVLEKATPDIPIVAEERAAAGYTPDDIGTRFWLVDPLDGTKEFIRGLADFTVNIGLIDDGRPVMGVVYAPARGELYFVAKPDEACLRTLGAEGTWSPDKRIQVRTPKPEGLAIVASKSHRNQETDDFIAKLPVKTLVSAGSSLKFCLVATGDADVYPRLGPTMEWDTAAGDAVLRAAGGQVTTLEGEPFLYGKPDFRNGFFVAKGNV